MNFDRSLIVALMTVLFVGCSSAKSTYEQVPVHGRVLVDGVPLGKGHILFVPLEGTPGDKVSAIIEQGDYLIETDRGLSPGRHRIEIRAANPAGFAPDDEKALEQLRRGEMTMPDKIIIPAIYNERSTLEREITLSGPNAFDFELNTNADASKSS